MSNPLLRVALVSRKNDSKSIVEQFKEFRNSFNGDTQAKIDELLASGRVTQFQINQAIGMANLMKVCIV